MTPMFRTVPLMVLAATEMPLLGDVMLPPRALVTSPETLDVEIEMQSMAPAFVKGPGPAEFDTSVIAQASADGAPAAVNSATTDVDANSHRHRR
jgi:hypothetical protein